MYWGLAAWNRKLMRANIEDMDDAKSPKCPHKK